MAVGNPISLTDNVASRIISQIATESQTDFTISGGYRLNAISVYRNGVRLVSGRDYSAADGSTVVLLSGASLSDVLEFHIFDDFRVADALVSNASHQNIEGNLTIAGILTVTTLDLSSLTVSDSISIGGTLTYEDVTNVDSIGIITARTDLHVGAGLSVIGVSTFSGNVDLGSNASTDTITATGRFDSDLIPSGDDARDIGSSSLEWRDLYVDGTGNIDSLVSGDGTFSTSLGIGTANPSNYGSDIKLALSSSGDTNLSIGAGVGKTSNVFFADGTSGDDRYRGSIRYAHDNDSMRFHTAAVERLRITSDGKIGIGNTTSPTADLEVAGTTGTASTIFINAPTHSSSKISEAVLKFGYAHSGSPDAVAEIKLVEGSTNSFGGHLTFSVPSNNNSGGSSTSEILRIRSTGMVGINTTTGFDTSVGLAVRNGQSGSDHTMIDIIANTNETSRVVFSDDADHNQGRIQYNHNGNSLGFYTNGNNERIHISSGGLIGMGAANNTSYDSNAQNLLLASSGNTGMTIRSAGDTPFAMIHFADGTSDNSEKRAGRIMYQHVGDNLTLHTANTERLRITGIGSVGIDVYGPQQKLDVVGSAHTVAVFRPDNSSVSAYGNASAVNNLINLRMPYGENPGSTNHSGARWGITFQGRNDGADYGTDTGKSASIYGVSEDVLGYNRQVGLAFYTSDFDANQAERLRISHDGSVGIGTDNPDIYSYGGKLLTVSDSSTYTNLILASSDASNSGISFGGQTLRRAQIQGGNGSDSDLIFMTNSSNSGVFVTEKVRIKSDGKVGISSVTPKTDVDISQKTGAVALPQGTTAQRPSGSAPYIRYNTTNSALEFYNGTSWVEIITDYFPTGSTILG